MSQRPRILFVLTVDTEEEWDWERGFPVAQYSVRNPQNVPKFQAFCEHYGVRPTYFIDYAIAANPASIPAFQEPFRRGACEIGAHLHPWVTPPIEEQIHSETTHAINLPFDLVQRKMQNLLRKLEAEFGMRPKVFRSGRWGMDGRFLRLLADEGFTIDSSIHPFYADSTFSYYEAPDTPYWPDFADCTKPGTQRAIFEIPVTSGFSRPDFRRWHRLHQRLAQPPWNKARLIGVLWHTRLLRKLQLSPELADAANMIRLVDACLQRGHRVLHMFLHSSSLLPGGSPYVANAQQEQAFYDKMAAVFTYLHKRADVEFCTLTEAKERY